MSKPTDYAIKEMYFTDSANSEAQPTLVDALRRIDTLERAMATLLETDDHVCTKCGGTQDDDTTAPIEGAKQVISSVARPIIQAATEDSFTTNQDRTNKLIGRVQAANRKMYN